MKYRWLQSSSVSGRSPASFQAEDHGLLPNPSWSSLGLRSLCLISNLPASWHSTCVSAESDCSLLMPLPSTPHLKSMCMRVCRKFERWQRFCISEIYTTFRWILDNHILIPRTKFFLLTGSACKNKSVLKMALNLKIFWILSWLNK